MTYCKRPFAGPEQVFKYLARYKRRVGLSNKRLLDVTDEAVTIGTRDRNTATMAPEEFIRGSLMHVLPSGYVKIHHDGLVASSNVGTKLEAAREAISGNRVEPTPRAAAVVADWRVTMRALTGVDLTPDAGASMASDRSQSARRGGHRRRQQPRSTQPTFPELEIRPSHNR